MNHVILSLIYYLSCSKILEVNATSMKMDFLPLGDVRTDPIINPDCLSDHVHTFYGANKLRPETTYNDLRNAGGLSGNVAENKSLYWHPTVYKVENGIYTKAEIYFASTYYIWTTGQATAFPDGFKMVAGRGGVEEARVNFECVGCVDNIANECMYTEFPEESCDELEVSMAFPTCWDGVNLDSDDHESHVSYDIEGGIFDGECPSTHPIKFPEIQFFFRILPYPGGTHVFADGTSIYHADYFSGWDQNELQDVLDNCENDSDAAMPDAWCEDHVTFRDAPKVFGEDDNIVSKLENFQPDPFDVTTITDETIDNISELVRGACTGTLKPAEESCSDSLFKFKIINNNGRRINRKCNWVAKNPTRCNLDGVDTHCPNTCNSCDTCINAESRFKFDRNGRRITRDCKWVAKKATAARCQIPGVSDTCRLTCGKCT